MEKMASNLQIALEIQPFTFQVGRGARDKKDSLNMIYDMQNNIQEIMHIMLF